SYLTYLRDRLMVAKELLHASGSVFVQISDENLHHVRGLLDEVFGAKNLISQISFRKTGGEGANQLGTICDFILWYARDKSQIKFRSLFTEKAPGDDGAIEYTNLELQDGSIRSLNESEIVNPALIPDGAKVFATWPIISPGPSKENSGSINVTYKGRPFQLKCPTNKHWSVGVAGTKKLWDMGRLLPREGLRIFKRFLSDFAFTPISNQWMDTRGAIRPLYVVQTSDVVVRRCILMTTEPGDLVLDPTCGAGTSAFVAEQWGRRWITIDTSRVPLALARQRLLTAAFPYFELKSPQFGPSGGFVYKRKQGRGQELGGLVPHVTLKSLANDDPPAMEVLVDRPEEVSGVTRVAGPFVVEATIAPVQSLQAAGDSNSATDGDAATHIQRMTEVLRQSKTLHLPGNRELTLAGVRRTVDTEYLHAEAREGDKRVAIVFGPADGAVSATLVFEAAREGYFLKYDRLFFFGFAIEPAARAMVEDEKKLRIPAAYVAVTPDVAMSDLLKTTRSSEIFSITGLPDATVRRAKKKGPEGQPLYEVELKGLDLFDPQSMDTESVGGENVPCWMLDTDYDGMSFYATQVFFPKTSAWDNLQRSLKATFDDSVWSHLAGTVSEPFALGDRRRVAVKVIDERGNELMRVLDVAE
ncbi:MAG: site-specific DNA-methyltransferase, partial [Thermomicrobiales bacterium]